jgi:hypothetical protein
MDVQSCIRAFTDLTGLLFKRRKHRISLTGRLSARYDAITLEHCVKSLCVQAGINEDALLLEGNDVECKT